MLACLSSAWAKAEAAWSKLHVEHKGFYSLERLQLLRHFVSRSNAVHNALMIMAMPLPTLAITLVCDCIPLAPPSAGAAANYVYWARAWVVIGAFTLAVFAQIHFNVTRLPQSWPRILLMTAAVASVHVAIHLGLSLTIGFPIPFGYLVMNVPWLSLVGSALWVHMGPQLRADPSVRLGLKKLGTAIYVASSLAVVYPLFYHLFLLLKDNPTGQFFFTFVLPVIKIGEKFLLHHFTTYMEDAQPVMITFNVEVFNALFVSSCMQNANSQATSVALMAMDFLGATYALVRLRDLTTTINALSAKVGIPREQLLHVATAIVHSSPDILIWKRTRISTVGYPRQHALAGESSRVIDSSVTPMPSVSSSPTVQSFPPHYIATVQCGSGAVLPGINAVVSPPLDSNQADLQDPDVPGSPSKDPALKRNAVAPAAWTGAGSGRTDGAQERFDSARVVAQLSAKERKKFVKETLKVLRRTEFLLLVEYTEVIVPTVYCTYLNVIYRLPNSQYFPYMREMDDAEFSATVHNIALYGALQLLSFLLFALVLVHKFRLPALGQLAFALQTQWQCVHACLVLWIVYALQSSLEHVGTDYTFKFAWLHERSA